MRIVVFVLRVILTSLSFMIGRFAIDVCFESAARHGKANEKSIRDQHPAKPLHYAGLSRASSAWENRNSRLLIKCEGALAVLRRRQPRSPMGQAAQTGPKCRFRFAPINGHRSALLVRFVQILLQKSVETRREA
jgi:hypothetical protein